MRPTQGLFLAAAAATLLLHATAAAAAAGAPNEFKTCVVGAGPAGLGVAWYLKQLGHDAPGDVVVLEARARAGGMVETWEHEGPSSLW